MSKKVHIIGGGTVFHLRSHLALCAPAYGDTARLLYGMFRADSALEPVLHLTRMAGGDLLETNNDIGNQIQRLTQEPDTKVIVMSAALCDYDGQIGDVPTGRYARRLQTDIDLDIELRLRPAAKVVGQIRSTRKDIFAVAFKATCGATADQQYAAALRLLKRASLNLVFANDVVTKRCMVVTPEEARYHEGTDRKVSLRGLVEMTTLRSQLTFTRSTVVDGRPVPWCSESIPTSLRRVVDYCISRQAYKAVNGVTAGHFACRVAEDTFLTSIRKSDFNKLHENGLVLIKTDGPDSVLAYGAKPSVGGQSQRIVFAEYPEYDCIVHFHCPKRLGSEVPTVSQREYECGSHECGHNTSRGLQRFGNLSAVYLAEHGPNIVFHSSIDPQEVIRFIDANFDLSDKTGGLVLSPALSCV